MKLPDDTRKKSVLLARAMGWEIRPPNSTLDPLLLPVRTSYLLIPKPTIAKYSLGVSDLYEEHHMSLAWRVHLWACTDTSYIRWWNMEHPWTHEDAQRRWLDKVLSLAIEAGLVEV